MRWMRTMRLSVMAVLVSGMLVGCSSDPQVDDPVDAGQADVLPDEDAADAGGQDTCLALPECEDGFEEVDSCEDAEGACGALTVCGETILCAAEAICGVRLECEDDEQEVDSCVGYETCRDIDACGEQLSCAAADASCNPEVGCADGALQVDTCIDLEDCTEEQACGETIYCTTGDVCEAEAVCPEETVEVESCEGVDDCEDVAMCGNLVHCAPEPDPCDVSAYECPAGLEAVAGEDCTVDLGPDSDRMCFTVEICPDVDVFCRGPVVSCTAAFDVCPEGYTSREDCDAATRECGLSLVCDEIGGCEANEG